MTRRADQRGYTLLVVLLAIAVFGLVITTLLSSGTTDLRVTAMARRTAQVRRAVDGALEAAVNLVKTSPGGTLGRANVACDPLPQITIEGVAVAVDCTPLTGPRSEVLPTTEGPALTLLGAYTAPVDDASAALARHTSDDVIGTIANQLSNVTSTVQSDLRATGPGLISTGPQPLRATGDVRVRTWTLAQRQTSPGVAVSPALDITGRFRQGDLGPLGGVGFYLGTLWVGTPSCGLLDPSFPLDFGVRVDATLGRRCGLGRSASEFADPSTPVASWTGSEKLSVARTVPASCTSAMPYAGNVQVVVIEPGYYSFSQTAQLNKWFTSTCHGVTFHFPPGDYYFDVAGGTGANRGALLFGDSTDRWVFGTPLGWDPATGGAPDGAFPTACDPSGDGVTITLSNRTTIQHLSGLAAVCGRRDATTGRTRLLYQERGTGSSTWASVPTAAVAGPNGSTLCGSNAANPAGAGFTPAADATGSSALPADVTGYPAEGSPWPATEAPAARSATATCSTNTENQPVLQLDGLSSAYGGSVTSLKLRVRGTSSRLNLGTCSGCSLMRATLTLADGTTCTLPQSAAFPTAADPVKTYVFSLDACPRLVDGSQLDAARITLWPKLMRSGTSGAATFSVDVAWLEVLTKNDAQPSAFTTLVDTDAGRGAWFFGPVQVPNDGVNVNWQGGASALPIFAGGLVAQGLASWHVDNGVQVGLLAAPSVQPASRRVLLRAIVGGRLSGSTVVTLDDATSDGTTVEAGRRLSIDDWRLCNVPIDPGVAKPCPPP